MAGVDHDHVEAGLLGAKGGFGVVVDDLVDHRQAHLLDHLLAPAPVFREDPHHARGSDGVAPSVQLAHRLAAAVVQLDGGQGPLALDGFGHRGKGGDVEVAAQVELRGLGDGPVGIDGGLEHGDDAGATLGLSPVELDQLRGRRIGRRGRCR